jgi:hypothetical protein
MTVESTVTKVTRNGNDVATSFSFSPLIIFETSDLQVFFVDADGNVNATPLNEGTGTSDYAVVPNTSLADGPSTGSITYPASGSDWLATGESLVIKRVVPLTQETDLNNQGGYFADVQENALDRATMINIQQQEELDRSVKAPINTPTDVDFTAPLPVGGRLVGGIWNASADAIETGPTADEISSAQGYAEAAQNAQAAAEDAQDDAEQAAEAAEAAQAVAEQAAVEAANKAARGTVNVMPPLTAGGASVILAPDGSVVDQTGSTTNGLQEADDYARAKGYDWIAHSLNGAPTDFMFQYMGAWVTATEYNLQQIALEGGSYYRCIVPHTSGTFATDLAADNWELFDYAATGLGIPTGWPTIAGKKINYRNTAYYMSTGLVLGSRQSASVDLSRITIVHTAASGDAVTLDSAYQANYKTGTIILSDSNTTGRTLKIAPTTSHQFLDGLIYDIPAFFHCRVEAMNLATISTDTVVGLELDAGGNAITECSFFINEVEGGLAAVRLVQPTGTGAIRGCTFHINRLYGPNVSGNYALEVGTATSGGSVSGNKFFIGSIMPLHTGARAMRIYGDDNYVLASVVNDEAGGDVAQGARFETSASNNVVIMPRCDATTPVSDASTDTSNTYQYEGQFFAPQIYALNQVRFSAFKSSSTNDVTGNGAQPTIVFDTELSDAGGNYDAGTGVFTAPRTGLYTFATKVTLTNVTALHTKIEVLLVTTGSTYVLYQGSLAAGRDSGNAWARSFSEPAVLMAAGNTARVQIKVSGAVSDDVDLFGNAASAIYTSFSGRAL